MVDRKLTGLNPFITLFCGLLFGILVTQALVVRPLPSARQECSGLRRLCSSLPLVPNQHDKAVDTVIDDPSTRVEELTLPSLQQRERVLYLMGTLTGRHTRNCHRTVQKHYRMQVYNRYTPIIGFEDRARHGFMSHVRRAAKQVSRLFEKETEVTRIFSSARRESGKSSGLQRSYEGHK